jgi:hypothetical protein
MLVQRRTRPHIGLVAEKGPEAIIPLNKTSGASGASVTVNAPITINGAAGEHADLSAKCLRSKLSN